MKKKFNAQILFIFIILFGGSIVGILGTKFVDHEYLTQLDGILLPLNETYDLYSTFVFQFTFQFTYILIILILGTSIIGTILISLILFTKGFQIGLTIMMFIYTYDLKGILGIVLTLIPQVILDILPIIIIALYSIELSNHIMFSSMNNNKLKIKNELNKGLNYSLSSILVALIASFLKVTLIIMLIRFFNQF